MYIECLLYNAKCILWILFIGLSSCKKQETYNSRESNHFNISPRSLSKNIVAEFQTILDTAELEGAILIFDQQTNSFYSNNFQESKKSYLPASTYKIPNSIIGLELGIIEGEEFIFKWDGEERALTIWEKDLSLKQAFQVSCVPCYQELARNIGAVRMRNKIEELNFGKMDIHEDNIDVFWLTGASRINSFQQVNFLKRFLNQQLPISKSTFKTIKSIMKIEKKSNHTLSGKTGLVVRGGKDIGWFVGYVEKGKKVYYFSTKISPKNENVDRSRLISLRKSIALQALQQLNIIEI